MGLYAASVSLAKAIDTVRSDGLWKILACLECPPKFLTILCQFLEGQQGQMKHNESLLDSFPISNSVKPGYIMTLTLFSIFFTKVFH